MKTEPIHTARLILRNMTPDDAENVWSLWGNPETGKYLTDEYYWFVNYRNYGIHKLQ